MLARQGRVGYATGLFMAGKWCRTMCKAKGECSWSWLVAVSFMTDSEALHLWFFVQLVAWQGFFRQCKARLGKMQVKL
jgi:hypothetical protein